jgi:hypothetical protein
MTARGALIAFGVLLSLMGVVLAVAARGRGDGWGVLVGCAMVAVAVGVSAMAVLAKPRSDEERQP